MDRGSARVGYLFIHTSFFSKTFSTCYFYVGGQFFMFFLGREINKGLERAKIEQ